MKYQKIVVGMMQTNAYIVFDEKTRKAVVIDPGEEGKRIATVIREMNLSLERILLTHGHFDHIGAVDDLKKEFPDVHTVVHKKDASLLMDSNQNLSFMSFNQISCTPADILLEGGEELALGESVIEVIHTPGHSGGSVSYLVDGVIFGGDTLFYESIGRYDYGSFAEIMDSLQNLMRFPDDTKVMPGHGPETTIGHERFFNPYLR